MENLQKTDRSYWMQRAEKIAEDSLCIRDESRIGAVAVKDGRIVETGFNGVVGNIPRCAIRGECIRKKMGIKSGTQREVAYCICAEQRMICNAARNGITLDGAEVYVTHRPCAICIRLLIEAGVARVFYKHEYVQQFTKELCAMTGFELMQSGTE